jgi:hypothetical protein
MVFRDGEALLPVYVAADASAEEKTAAEDFARVLGAMAGTEWPVLTESARGGAGLYVGRTRAAAREMPELKPARDLLAPMADEVGPDGFRIRTVGRRVFVEGATPEATPYAVSWLLQRYAGVRWYAPGPLGEAIPRRTEWALPELSVVREPAYVSREISGLRGVEGREWARRNGLRQRLEYSHNLVNVFTPEVYDAHPEWFGVVRGERRRPRGGGEYRWQPDLSRADVAEYAATQAAEALARGPSRSCFSLGMNDSVRFDQGEGTRRLVEPLRYFRGMPDYSLLVFTFMNRAAVELGRQPGLEGRYLGCLAYFWCENPPPFPVDARVVPYVTTDRTQFYDAAYRAADYALMSRWHRSGVRAYGLWEYAEGSAFIVPRVPHAMLAEAVREGWWRGARGYMGECGPHNGFDAFKVWMLAQLLWEPDRPLAELEDDFFSGWYGPAAPAMRRFFARSEQVWMAQPGPPWWIKFYQQQDQVLLFPPKVCLELRAILDEAMSIAECGSRNADLQQEKCGNQESRNGGRRAEDRGRRADAVTGNKVASDRIAEGGGRRADSGLDRSGTQEIRKDGRQKITKGTKLDDEGRSRLAEGAANECGNLEIGNGGGRTEDGGLRTDAVTGNKVTSDRKAEGGGRRTDDGERRTEGGVTTTEGREQTTEGGARTEEISRKEHKELRERAGACLRAKPLYPETRNLKPVTPNRFLEAVRLTSRAFAVTEAAVAFDGLRRALATADTGKLAPPELGRSLAAMQRARERLVLAIGEATQGETPALSTAYIDYLLRNDPVPGLLVRLSRSDRKAPTAALAELAEAGVSVPSHWAALATALGERRLTRASNLLSNGTFAEASPEGQQPQFLYPRSGELPADWNVRAVATEHGRVALGPAFAGVRVLRVEGAWDTGIGQTQLAEPGRLYVAEVQMRGRSSPGNDAALTLAFVDAGGKTVGEYRSVMLPKGESGWRALALAANAPENAKYVVVGVAALRQFGGDWIEATGVSLRVAE